MQVVSEGQMVLAGDRMNILAVMDRSDTEGLSLVVDREGLIEALGFDEDIREKYKDFGFDEVIDATDKCIIPGLVDAHTHAVWAGDRVHEFALKLAGASYLDIHKAGGGIHFTVNHVTAAAEESLYCDFKKYAKRMLSAGTTLLECKSGYGLTLDPELKMLRVLTRAKLDPLLDLAISSTYCAAHAVPKGKTAAAAADDIITNQLPHIKQLLDRKQLLLDNIDVFCERDVFDVEQTRQILTAGQAMGLNANFHGEELTCLHSAEMAAEIKATAVSHLEEVSAEGVKKMAEAGTIGILLPTTAFMLRLTPPPARDMISGGMAVALGSDFNPNAHCFAMPIVMHLACVLMKMTMAEALVAATINSAAALRLSDKHGSLEVGKLGNMLILDAPRWEHLIYQLGGHNDVISHVIVNGRVVDKK